MKTKIILSVLALVVMASAFGQKPTLELTFTAIDNVSYVQLDSIKVMNRTQVSNSVIYWPDTTLTMEINPGDLLLYIGYSTGYPVGIQEINHYRENFQVFQNYPNPVKDHTMVSLYIPEKGTVNIMVTDIQGRVVIATDLQLNEGHHSFRFIPGYGNFFFLTARWNDISRSIKILTTEPNVGLQCLLDYIGNSNKETSLKASSLKMDLTMLESGILDTPDTNETYTFEFATNIPCPGTPTVTYDGQVYNTIQIFGQCWLKENLNVGTMIPETQSMSNNIVIEKYCYNNEQDSCTKYGGLYQWDEMMQYTSQQGVQGICPSGWHLPTDEEWKVLEGTVDSQYGIGDPKWDIEYDYRGFDAGLNLKSISGWNYEGNGTDLFGFSGLPGGYVNIGDYFIEVGFYGYWWASTEGSGGSAWSAWSRVLSCGRPEAVRSRYSKYYYGYSVRCLRDN
jgi:uncharacterized protein (TIGR02145 family)